jgi:LAS superfamily LD-carboxypeptidase LdcB
VKPVKPAAKKRAKPKAKKRVKPKAKKRAKPKMQQPTNLVPIPAVRKLVLPNTLQHITPGELPANMLVDLKPYGKLHPRAANAYNAIRTAAFAAGIKQFKPISRGDTYRSTAQQTAGFLQRYTLIPIEGTSTRTWCGRKYYLKPGNAPLAAPGTSRHNLGLACDFANMAGDTWAFMCKHGPAYGWSLEVMPGEPWHWFYYPGDKIPEPVTLYLEGLRPVSPPSA